jgi:hypothetical protein
MLGAAAESIVLEIRDATATQLSAAGIKQPKNLSDWRVKTVLDALADVLTPRLSQMPHDLQVEYEAYWPAFTQQIRSTRNDAGHPSSVDPVTPNTVHASFLLFPELAKIATRLLDWMPGNLR